MFRLFTLVIVAVTLIGAVTFICALEGASNIRSASDEIGKSCSPVNCRGKIKKCPYGYEKKDGCEICKCHDPCNPPGKPILCGSTKRCYVDKKVDGTFAASCHSPRSKREAVSKAICNNSKIVKRTCMSFVEGFHYNSATKKCEKFFYRGCGGNKNHFNTKAECEAACLT